MTLSDYLKANSLTQTQFAEMLGKSQGFVAKLCSDTPHLTLDTAVSIELITDGAVPVQVWPQFQSLKHIIPARNNETAQQEAEA